MHMEIFAVVEKFPNNKCVVSFQAWKKRFIKCMGILPLMSCNKTIGNEIAPPRSIDGNPTFDLEQCVYSLDLEFSAKISRGMTQASHELTVFTWCSTCSVSTQ
jgi:hypothetical protein